MKLRNSALILVIDLVVEALPHGGSSFAGTDASQRDSAKLTGFSLPSLQLWQSQISVNVCFALLTAGLKHNAER
jgi:hypothetical protein